MDIPGLSTRRPAHDIRETVKATLAQKRAEKADLITLPEGITGASCGNCGYQKDGMCLNEKVDQPVEPTQCCSLWDHQMVVRPWEVEKEAGKKGKKSLFTVDEIRKYSEDYHKKIKEAGDWLKDCGMAMPGYGQIFRNLHTNALWYVGGDGDEDGFSKVVEEKLKEANKNAKIIYESEHFPPKDEWEKIYPAADKKSLEADKIPGGLSDDKPDAAFDEEALQEGIQVELEHTSDPAVAREIAQDHLTEDSQYYRKLRKIEGKSSDVYFEGRPPAPPKAPKAPEPEVPHGGHSWQKPRKSLPLTPDLPDRFQTQRKNLPKP